MSTHDPSEELSGPNVVRASAEHRFTEEQSAGSGNDRCLAGTSNEYSQTTKNLYIRRRILLKSKGEWGSTPDDQKERPDQLRFTSFLSLRFPSERTIQNQTDSQTESTLISNKICRNFEAIKRPTDLQHPELCEKALPTYSFGQSTVKAAEDGNVSKPPFENEGTHPQLNSFGHDAPSHRSPDGLQCSVALCDRAQTQKNCSKTQSSGFDYLTQLPLIESQSAAKESAVNVPLGKNAEVELAHSNLIPFWEESGSKASPSCQSSACSPRELKQALSVPSFPDPHHSCKLETNPDLISPTAPMFTSTIVSVLAPHWSGCLRRHKQGVGEVEQDSQTSGQNVNLSASSQNTQQQPFPLTQIKPGIKMLDESNSKLREPAGTNRHFAEWERDTRSPHLTSTLQTKRPVLKPTYSNQQTVDSNNEFRTSAMLPPDTDQVTVLPHSPQFSGYNRISQPGDQGESFSPPTSRPTTSSLLLSWRRLNSRTPNADSSEMERRLATSVNSLTLLSKSILKISQPRLLHPEDPTNDIASHTFTACQEQPQGPETSDFPRSREVAALRNSVFLSKRLDITCRTSSDTTEERLYLSSPTKPSQPETPNAPQHCSNTILQRKFSHVGNNASGEQSITDYTNMYNSNMNTLYRTDYFPSTRISPKDNTNNNIGNSISHQYPDINHAREMSPNLSTFIQSNSTNDVINSNKVNASTPSTSKSTQTCSSHTSSSTIHKCAVSPSAGLTPIFLTQTGHITQISSSFCPENVSPSPTNSMSRTFTGSLALSPRKPAVEGTSPSHILQNYLTSKQSQSNRNSSDLESPLSPSRPLRRVCAPSIYSYLRETSPPLTTKTSSEQTSANPQTSSLKQDGDQMQKVYKDDESLRFTFDLSPLESQDMVFIQDSCTSSAPQSLPPDFGKRSMPRLSKSPYSTLISARPALNSTLHNLSSPPASYHHGKSASYDSSPTPASNTPNTEKRSYPSMPKDRLIQGVSAELSGSSDKQLKAKKTHTSFVSLDTQSSPDTRFTECQTTNVILNTTHPKQSDIIIKHILHEGRDHMFPSQSDKGNAYTAQGLNYEKHSSPLRSHTISEAVPEVVTALHTHEMVKGIKSTNSKRNIFSRNKKDNILTSATFAGKESFTHQGEKEVMTEPKSSNKMDQVLNRLKLKFGVKRADDDFTTRRKTRNLSQQSSASKASESNKKDDRCHESQSLKSLISSDSQVTSLRKSHNSSGRKEHKNSLKVNKQGRLADENGNQYLDRPQSPNLPKPHYINRYATMPQTRKTTLGFSPASYLEFALKDAQNDDVFYFPTKRKSTFIYKTENVPPTGNAMDSQRQHLMGAHLSASCADLKYGLERGRSVSVSTVVSSRPSGPGRISTGSKQGSVSDLSSLDEFVIKSRHSSITSPSESPGYDARGPSSLPVHNTYKGCVRRLSPNERLWSPVNLESSPYSWDTEEAPTPPPSPPFSPSSQRMSQIPSSSSAGSRNSQDSLSPRGFLPSRNYKSTLSVFEESSSDTTTDDEYYLNSDDGDDEKETEL